jgi:hypothetical protein
VTKIVKILDPYLHDCLQWNETCQLVTLSGCAERLKVADTVIEAWNVFCAHRTSSGDSEIAIHRARWEALEVLRVVRDPSMAHRSGAYCLWPSAPACGAGVAGGDLSAVSGLHPRETCAVAASAVRPGYGCWQTTLVHRGPPSLCYRMKALTTLCRVVLKTVVSAYLKESLRLKLSRCCS